MTAPELMTAKQAAALDGKPEKMTFPTGRQKQLKMDLKEYHRIMAQEGRAKAKAAGAPRPPSKLEETLALHLRTARIPFEREVTFHPTRKWRFDFLITGTKIAIECEGGIYSEGRTGHSSITGIERDIEKGNAATLLGYRVFRFTEKMINNGEALRLIEQAIRVT